MFKDIKRAIVFWVVFFLTVSVLSLASAALTAGLTTSDKVTASTVLSSTTWNKIVDSILELDSRTLGINTSGSIGVNKSSPDATVDVNGDLIRSVFYYEPGAVSNVAFPANVWTTIGNGWTFNYTKKSATSKLLITVNTVARWNYNTASGWWYLGFKINGITYEFWANYTNTTDLHTPGMYRRAISGLPKWVITLEGVINQAGASNWVCLGCAWVPNITIEEIY